MRKKFISASEILPDLNERQIVLCERAERRHQGEHRASDFARDIAHRLHHQIDVVARQAARPHVHEPGVDALVLLVGMKVDRGDDRDQVADLRRVERRITQ